VFSGDYLQSDFRYEDEKSGVLTFLKILANMPEDFKRIDFQIEDVVRSGIVKRYLFSEHELRQRGQI
jgi:predicted ester cyclase